MPDERRIQTQSFIEKLLVERQDMLVLFCRVAGLDPCTDTQVTETHVFHLLDEFCQILVDYIAAGHFILYQRILEQRERRHNVLDVAEQLYPRITQTTEAVSQFNDKYECPPVNFNLEDLQQDLSILGEQLALRIDVEDQLLQTLISNLLTPPQNNTRH